MLSFCAAATTTLEVGTALAVQPMRDPFWLAKTAATIDQLSNGRLILALGIGAYREEFAAWAPRLAPKAQRGEMMDEGLELMRRLFTERRVTHEGKYYAVKDIEMYPKPKRDPFALWLGGHNKPTIERTARFATGWLPGWRPWPELAEWIRILKDRAAELGRDPKEIEIAPQFSVTIAKTRKQAEKRYMAVGPGRSSQVARLYRPRPLQAGRRQPRRLARPDPGEGRRPAEDRRRSRLRPDDPRRFDGRVRGSGRVVRQDGAVDGAYRERRRFAADATALVEGLFFLLPRATARPASCAGHERTSSTIDRVVLGRA